MKRIFNSLLALSLTFFLISGCDGDYGYPGGVDIAGSQSPMGEVGNTFSGSTMDGFENFTGEVIELVDGISTVRVTGTITDTKMKALLNQMSSRDFVSYNSGTGKFTADLKFKFTDKGIVDYNHREGYGWTAVNYSDGVGKTYAFKDADGDKYERSVTQKSTDDDYPYGFFYIKTITVEEPSRSPLIRKVVYKFNHRFGPVNVRLELADGHAFESKVYSYAEND